MCPFDNMFYDLMYDDLYTVEQITDGAMMLRCHDDVWVLSFSDPPRNIGMLLGARVDAIQGGVFTVNRVKFARLSRRDHIVFEWNDSLVRPALVENLLT